MNALFWLYALTLPLIGALIGWVTNLLAVKLLFRPYQPLKIPGLPLSIQGVLPKRRRELARSIGETIESELLTFDDLLDQVRTDEMTERLSRAIGDAVHEAVMLRTPGLIPGSIKKFIADTLADIIEERTPNIVDWLADEVAHAARDEIKIGRMVEEKMNSFPLEILEEVVYRVASREIRHITAIGGVLGFVVGLFQVLLLYLSRLIGTPVV
jgi:uncharacterized membrane protein YheB (UPF0754 family)